jgi:hypothetical protein
MDIASSKQSSSDSWWTSKALRNFIWWGPGALLGVAAAIAVNLSLDPEMDTPRFAGFTAVGMAGGVFAAELARRIPWSSLSFYACHRQGREGEDPVVVEVYSPLPGGPASGPIN